MYMHIISISTVCIFQSRTPGRGAGTSLCPGGFQPSKMRIGSGRTSRRFPRQSVVSLVNSLLSLVSQSQTKTKVLLILRPEGKS